MDKPRFQTTEAIVLKHHNIGEADRIITFYTPHLGQLRAVAKGARKVKSRLAGHLELLTRSHIMVNLGRGDLGIVSQSETVESNMALRQDLWRMTCGLYMAELVERFTQEAQENRPLYDLFQECLSGLGGVRDLQLLLRYFEMRLLSLVGFEPELFSCVECRVTLTPAAHFFSPSAGGVLCAACRMRHSLHRPLSLNALKVLRLLAGHEFSRASSLHVPAGLALELEGVVRQYMRYLLEQELKSTDFLDLVKRDALARADAPLDAGVTSPVPGRG